MNCSEINQWGPLSKVRNKPLQKCKIKFFNSLQSPVATEINTFENEDRILNRLSQIGGTPEFPENKSPIMASKLSSSGNDHHSSMFRNRSASKHRNVTVSRPSKSLVQTYKYSSHSSPDGTGTRRLEKFLKEYSQDTLSKQNPRLSNMPIHENVISSTSNSLIQVKDEAREKYKNKGLVKNNSFWEKSSVSSKIHGKNTLDRYFKEMKNIKRTLKERGSSRASGSTLDRFSDKRNSVSLSIKDSSYCADLDGCARTKGWSKAKLHILNKGTNSTKEIRYKGKTVNAPGKVNKSEFSSPCYKGLDFIRDFDEKYYNYKQNKSKNTKASSSGSSSGQIKGKCRTQKLDRWLKSNPLQINTNVKNGFKSSGSKNETKGFLRKSSSEMRFTTRRETSRIIEHKRRNDQIRKNFYERYPNDIAKMSKNQPISKNTITRYFSKDKLTNSNEITNGHKTQNWTIERNTCSRALDCKEKTNLFRKCALKIDITKNAATAPRNMLINSDRSPKNSNALDNMNQSCLASQYLDTKHYYPSNMIGQNSKKETIRCGPKSTIQKSQKNIFSSEGFCESMSVETPTPKNHQKSHLNSNYTKSASNSLEINQSFQYGSNRRSKNNISNIKSTDKFKQISSLMNLLSSQPERYSPTPERRKLTLSEERELSPDFYVMKMCGPESEAIVKKILNSHKTVDQEHSLQDNKKEEDSLNLGNWEIPKCDSQNILSLRQIAMTQRDSPSDPLSFGSSSLTFSGNMNCSQVDKRPAPANCSKLLLQGANTCSQNKHGSQKYCFPSHLTEITRNAHLSREFSRNSQSTQKREKLNAQTIESLCKLHESNSWNIDGQAQHMKNVNGNSLWEKSSAATQSPNLKIKQNTTMQPESTTNPLPQESPILISKKYGTESYLATKNTLSSEMFASQSSFNVLPNLELTNIAPLSSTQGNEHLPIHANTSNVIIDPFSYEPLTQSFQNILYKNCSNLDLKSSQNGEESIQQSHVNHTRTNCDTVKGDDDGHLQTNYEELEAVPGTQTQTETFTENILGTQTANKKLKKTYNITEDCVLYQDNLLKSLIEDTRNNVKTTKTKVVRQKCGEKLHSNNRRIKRYKKGNVRIFKIKRRVKKKVVKNYNPPEAHIMDRFLKKFNNDFQDESSGNSDAADDDESVCTPESYQSDKTKSDALSTGSSKLTTPQKLLREGINKLSKDKSLLFANSEDCVPSTPNRFEIIANIERIVNQVLEDYVQGRNIFFKIPKEDFSNVIFANDRYQIRNPPKYTTVCYKNTGSRPRFNLILLLLNKIKHLLETDTKLTKREIFYQLKTMITAQWSTDTVLKDISRMLNVGIWELNVTAQKGLVYGNLKLIMADGETINCNVPGTLIPLDISKICEVQSTAYFILVIEKESIFHKLLEENLPNRLTRPFIMITGKGFPDLNTQLFLKKLWMVMSIPVFILVDADPAGIAIMLNYRFGSIANAHVSEHLAVPKARWLGVFPSEILRLSLSYEELSKRDISMTRKLLQLPCVQRNENIQYQLRKMLEIGIKTGIESLVKTDVYLSNSYLNWKFYTNNLI